jgi:hypothetical protein
VPLELLDELDELDEVEPPGFGSGPWVGPRSGKMS